MAANLAVHQKDFVGRVEIPNVVGNFLVIPAQLACVGVERNDARGIEIHVLSLVDAGGNAIAVVEIGRGVPGAPVD